FSQGPEDFGVALPSRIVFLRKFLVCADVAVERTQRFANVPAAYAQLLTFQSQRLRRRFVVLAPPQFDILIVGVQTQLQAAAHLSSRRSVLDLLVNPNVFTPPGWACDLAHIWLKNR